MLSLLILLVGLPVLALGLTYGAGRVLGRSAARAAVFFCSMPVGLAGWELFRFWRQSTVADQGRIVGISGIGLIIALGISFASMLGLFLAGRRRSKPEVGTGLNP